AALVQAPSAGNQETAPNSEATLPAAQAAATDPTQFLQQQVRAFETSGVVHQPLIQVKMRVVEVARNDSLEVASVLDFVGQKGNPNTLIRGNNINNNMRNVSGATRFSVVPPDLIMISG